MCGLFGYFSSSNLHSSVPSSSDVDLLVHHSQQRGQDASGVIAFNENNYDLYRSDLRSTELLKSIPNLSPSFLLGHSRLITDGLNDNQPVAYSDIAAIHNGIIVNHEILFNEYSLPRKYQVDTEILVALSSYHLECGESLSTLPQFLLKCCKGTISAAILFKSLGKLLLLSNNGSLFYGRKGPNTFFSSEKFPLSMSNCHSIEQLRNSFVVFDSPISDRPFVNIDIYNSNIKPSFLPALPNVSSAKILEYRQPELRRCTKCILPETMPFIEFNEEGVCNYCTSYRPRNNPKPLSDLFDLLEPFRRLGESDCIFPFSGGRDSCWGLHMAVKELGLRPIAYTYDWGMISDLGRRNISRMCSALGVENIIVAANIARKRNNIKKNIMAWLKSPDLGMVSLFTAGDKHFFRFVNSVRRQTGISLNLWSINPLEVTHFKSGYLGLKPNFLEDRVYSSGFTKQLKYQYQRAKRIAANPGYLNSSLLDTLSGEYWRSISAKIDYFHLFDYYQWDETICNSVLDSYEWERAIDTNSTWRIGDATAPFYNYIYYHVAGFTEHDTFRSNQIREGQLTRSEALDLVREENRPRYQNLKWYLDALSLDFDEVISSINGIKPLYEHLL